MTLLLGFGDYQVQVVGGIERALRERGIPLLAVCVDGFASKVTSGLVLELIRRRASRGVIVLSDVATFARQDLRVTLSESAMPVVTIGTKLHRAPYVSCDNDTGMRALMGHLLDECGVRRPVLIRGVSGHPESLRREEVIRQECTNRGVVIDGDLVLDGQFQAKPAHDALHRLLRQRRDFDAVIAFNDTSALGALSALRDQEVQVPQDVVVSGFDNMRIMAETWPPLTTVDQRLDEQGGIAVELLLRLMTGERDVGDALIPSRLVTRFSTGGDVVTVDQLLPITCALQARSAMQENVLGIGIDMANCRSVDDLTSALEVSLPQAGISRCFLALASGEATGRSAPPGSDEQLATLALHYRDGRPEPVTDEVFSRYRLLPDALRPELDTGCLVVQPMAVEGRERGHLMYDLTTRFSLLAEAIRLELPRAVDTILSSRELRSYTSTLERMVAERTRELETANAALQRSVMLDGLTEIANRNAFERVLEHLGQARDGEYRQVALLMADVDLFKAYNDHYGHLAGDTALKIVAACLKNSARAAGDIACRYGGEEFAVILQDCGVRGAVKVAQRFMRLLEQAAIPHERSTVAPVVTASVGIAVAAAAAERDLNDLIRAADAALYEAKARGRHRFVVAEPPGQVPRPRSAGTTAPRTTTTATPLDASGPLTGDGRLSPPR
jgi:diguanylate cyclase (GGDEF)-like protein